MKTLFNVTAIMLLSSMAWSQTNTFPSTGSAGVGTTSPVGKFQVIGDSGWDTSTRLFLTNGATDYGRTNLVLTGRLQGGNDAWSFGSDARNSIVFSSNDAAGRGLTGTEQFSLQHEQVSNKLGFLSQTKGALPIMVMTQSGNVGVGMANPQAPLAINGTFEAYTAGNAGATGALKLRLVSGGSSTTIVEANNDGSWTNHDIVVNGASTAGGNSNQLVVHRSGNIGIRTASPQAALDVASLINGGQLGTVFGRLGEGNSSGSGTFLGVRGYGTQQTDYDGKSFAIEHSFYGNVNSSINFYRGGGVTGGYITFNTSDNTEQMRIFTNGNVGIGTTNTDAKLTVKGDIHTREVRVDVQGGVGPDYVFEKDYDLRPLAEVENYINVNKHLPEVPSAKEMESEGLNLKEMNILLLKKVEELTLHLIAKEKEIGDLQQRVRKLEDGR